MGKFKDLTGQKFGRLTVIKRAEDYISPKGCHDIQWLCECDCKEHNQVIVRGGALKDNRAKSCGCLQREKVSIANKKYNKYNLSGEYGIGYTSKGEEFYFDLEDYDKIKDYCWYLDKRGYVVAYNKHNKKNDSNISLHRLLMASNGTIAETIDHINHIKYDNRKCNLRICSQKENNRNRLMPHSKTSKVTGVRKTSNNKWDAIIQVDGKSYSKRFDNFDDAVAQRIEWENKFQGEYSYNNSINLMTKSSPVTQVIVYEENIFNQ